MALKYELSVQDNGTVAIKRFNDHVKRLKGDTDQASKSFLGFSGAAKSAMGALGGMVTAGALVGFVKSTIDAVDAANDFAQQVGISTRAVVGFGYAAQMSGSSADEMQDAMRKLANNLATGGANESLKALGISAVDASGNLRGVDSVMIDVAGQFSHMKDGTAKAAIAMDLFGKSGAKMIPTLNNGAEGLRSLADEGADAQGITDDNAQAMARFNDALDQSVVIGRGFVTWLLDSEIPAVGKLGDLISQTAKDWAQFNRDRQSAALIEDLEKYNEVLGRQAQLQKQVAEYKRVLASNDVRDIGNHKAVAKAMVKVNEEIKANNAYLAERTAKLNATAQAEKTAAEQAAAARKAAADAGLDGSGKKPKASNKGSAREVDFAAIQSERLDRMAELSDKAAEIREEEAQAARKAMEERLQAEDAEASEREQRRKDEATRMLAVWDDFYTSDRDYQKQKIDEKAAQYRDAGVDEIEVMLWAVSEKETIERNYLQQMEKEREEARQRELAGIQETLGWYGQMASNLQGIFRNLSQYEQNEINARYDTQKQKLDEAYTDRMEAASGDAARQSALQTELANKEKAIETKKAAEIARVKKKYAAEQKLAALADTGIKGAQAIVNIMATAPAPLWPGLITFSSGLTATELAIISQQKAYARGGLVDGGRQSITVNEEGPEFVSNASSTARNRDLLEAMNRGASREALATMAGNGGGSTIHINVGGMLTESYVANTLVPAIQKHLRKR